MLYVLLKNGMFKGMFVSLARAIEHIERLHTNCVVNCPNIEDNVNTIIVTTKSGDWITSYEGSMTQIQ